MKQLQKYRVIRAYGPYRVGDIIQPTGMLRDELKACGRIEKYHEPEPVVEPEPVTESEPEEAVIPKANIENTARRRGRFNHG